MVRSIKDGKKVNYINSFQEAVNILEKSLDDIEKWECDFNKLEVILRDNHGGWERLFKTYRLLFSQKKTSGHNLLEQIGAIEKGNMILCDDQNLNKIFLSGEFKNYFKLLDSLFDTSKNRYANIEEIQGKNSVERYLVDDWVKGIGVAGNNLDFYEEIKKRILEINKITLRFFLLQFSRGERKKLKIYAPIFNEYNGYWSERFS